MRLLAAILVWLSVVVSKVSCSDITKEGILERGDKSTAAIFVVEAGKRLSVAPTAVTKVRHPNSCSWTCLQNNKCWSFNLAVRKIQDLLVCELLSTDKYSSTAGNFQDNVEYNHYRIESRCEHACLNGGSCQHDYEKGDYTCHCPAGIKGKNCEWKKVNTNQVCFSAKGDQFGGFSVPQAVHIKAFKLVHLSGRVAAYHGAGTNWGTQASRFDTIITTNANQVVSPPLSMLHSTFYEYSLPGVSASDPQLILPEITPPIAVTAGQGFRVWFGEDLKGSTEGDNGGTTCADVYVNYKQ